MVIYCCRCCVCGLVSGMDTRHYLLQYGYWHCWTVLIWIIQTYQRRLVLGETILALIIFPAIFLVTLSFIFSTALEDHSRPYVQYGTIMNCPFPLNSAVATLNATQHYPQISYTYVIDNDTSAYHVSTFECQIDNTSDSPSINTRIYTGSNNWYDVTGRASGYMFYISEMFHTIGVRIDAWSHLAYLFITAPEQVTGIAFFTYIQGVLTFMVGLGIFLAIRGGSG